MPLAIEYIDINKIVPYENNPRQNEEAVKYVAASLKSFGWRVPCVVDSGNVLVCGHTRLLAAKKLGMETVPCVRVDDLTQEEVQAYRLADNKTAEFAKWDEEKLSLELEQLHELDIDMTQYGFDVKLEKLEEPEPVAIPEIYSVLVMFKSEDDQMEFFAKMKDEGMECRLSYL